MFNVIDAQQDPIGLAGGLNLYGYADGDPINFSDPFGLSSCAKDLAEKEREACDFLTFGLTKVARNAIGCGDCVDYSSGVYTAGQISGGVTGAALGGLTAARAAGVTSRVAIHGAHHTFPVVGRAVHVQVNVWRIGVKGSGSVLRIPLPWR